VSIVILVPSRGRPKRCRDMVNSVKATSEAYVRVIAIVDADDPTLSEYARKLDDLIVLPERLGYTGSLNAIAREVWDEYTIVGAFGDDVLFRTPYWDRAVEQALTTPGIAYGDDQVHAQGHPTAVWMSSAIAKELGWLALPASYHLWVDDAWKALGQATDTLRYLPSVIVEHVHPAVGKAPMDDTYRSVYDSDRAHQDHLGFLGWQESGLEEDAAKVRAICTTA